MTTCGSSRRWQLLASTEDLQGLLQRGQLPDSGEHDLRSVAAGDDHVLARCRGPAMDSRRLLHRTLSAAAEPCRHTVPGVEDMWAIGLE